MKRVLLALLMLLPTAVMAGDQTALVCLYKPLNFRFNLVNQNGIDMIQWEGSQFQAVILNVDDKFLTVKHYARTATFRAILDKKTLLGYGNIELYSGEKSEGEIMCAVD